MLTRIALAPLLAMLAVPAAAEDPDKVLFLVMEEDAVIASNTYYGRFDKLELHAKEKINQSQVADAVAIVATNQRFIAYGVLTGGWQSLRRKAQEELVSIEAEDYSATVVTSDRILNFSARSGAWRSFKR